MKTPWKYVQEKRELEEKIQQMEKEIENLKQGKEKYRNKFEAEEKRRSDLSTEKQEAQKKLNKVQQRLENRSEKQIKEKQTGDDEEKIQISFKEARKGLKKLSTINSSEKDLLTVYSGEEDFNDVKALKNSISQEIFSRIHEDGYFIIFTDENFFNWKMETRPFFESSWSLRKNFRPSKLIDFIDEEKYWAIASMGETEIFREQSGDFEKIDRVKTRVNRQQKKGGFSQGRFERKREKQITGHVDKVNEALEELGKDVYLLGDKRLCEDIEAQYLGGYDSSRRVSPDVFYNFQMTRF